MRFVFKPHLEEREKHSGDEKSDSFLEYEGKGKKNSSIKIEKQKLTCKHCLKNGHD